MRMRITRKAKRTAKELFRLCLVNGLLDEARVRVVVEHVLSAGQRDCPAILAHFRRLVRLDRALHTALIESVTSLSANLQDALRDGLDRRYGPGLTAAFAQRPELIGGMRIQVGSDVYDGSVRARLAALEKSF